MSGAGRVRGVPPECMHQGISHSKRCSQSRTEAKFKLRLICQQGSKKKGGGVVSLYYRLVLGPVASHRVGQC